MWNQRWFHLVADYHLPCRTKPRSVSKVKYKNQEKYFGKNMIMMSRNSSPYWRVTRNSMAFELSLKRILMALKSSVVPQNDGKFGLKERQTVLQHSVGFHKLQKVSLDLSYYSWLVSQWPWYIFSSPCVLAIVNASLTTSVFSSKIFYHWKFKTRLRNSDLVSHVLHWEADGGECSALIHLDLTVTSSAVN